MCHQLNQMIRDMSCHMNEHIDAAYDMNEAKHGKHDGRKMRHKSMDDYEKSWSDEV